MAYWVAVTVRVGVGVVVLRDDQILLIRRGKPPKQGEWSLPGGHVEPGEDVRSAAQREVEEETGLRVHLHDLVDVVDLIEQGAAGVVERQYVLIDFWATAVEGTLCAGDDATQAAWHDIGSLANLDLWNETLRVIDVACAMRDHHPPVVAEHCNNMGEVRAGIDAIDRELVTLLAKRSRYIEAAARIKTACTQIHDDARIADVLAKTNRAAAGVDAPVAIVEATMRALIDASIKHEYRTFDKKGSD